MNNEPWWAKIVHCIVVTGCAILVMLVTATVPSGDDVAKATGIGATSWLAGFLFGRK